MQEGIPKGRKQNQKLTQTRQIQPEEDCFEIETSGFAVSSDSDNTIVRPAIYFKRYLGPTGVRYINMGQASKLKTIQNGILKKQ